MPKSLVNSLVSLNDYPVIHGNMNKEITIGDLHANALKFIHLLVREGIFLISRANYDRFHTLYKIPAENITIEEFEEIKAIIQALEPQKTHTLVRLIGDEHADRGSNDWYIDLILRRMHTVGIPYEIILSNHSYQSIKKFEHIDENTVFFDPHTDSQKISLNQLIKDIETEIDKIVDEVCTYLEKCPSEDPAVELFCLHSARITEFFNHVEPRSIDNKTFDEINKDYLDFYQKHQNKQSVQRIHAQLDKEYMLRQKLIRYQAKHHEVFAKDAQTQSLSNLQILINRKFITTKEVVSAYQESYLPYLHLLSYTVDPINRNITIYTHAGSGLNTLTNLARLFRQDFCFDTFSTMIHSLETLKSFFHKNHVMPKQITKCEQSTTVFKFVWNRDYSSLHRPHQLSNYTLDFVHGHDDKERNRPKNVFCLDNKLGHIHLIGRTILPQNIGEDFILRTDNEYSHEQLIEHYQQRLVDIFQQSNSSVNKRKYASPEPPYRVYATLIEIFQNGMKEEESLEAFIDIYCDTIKKHYLYNVIDKRQLDQQIQTLKNLYALSKKEQFRLQRLSIFQHIKQTNPIEKLNELIDLQNENICSSAAP